MMADEERRQWLMSLKAGDKVLRSPTGAMSTETIVTIDRITSKGTIFIGSEKFVEGRKKYDSWSWVDIEPITPEARKRLVRERRVSKLRGFREWESLSDKQLETIIEIIFSSKKATQ